MRSEEYALMRQVEDSHWWYVSLHSLVLEMLARHAAEGMLLDMGCGTGGLMSRITPKYAVNGLDIAPEALRCCQERGLKQCCQASALALPYPDQHFTALLSMDVIYHRQVADPVKVLQEAHRVLKPGGVVLVNVPAYAWLRSSHDEAVHTARRFRKKELRTLAETAHLEVVFLSYWNTLLFPLIVLTRMMRKLVPDRGSDLEGASTGTANTLLKGLLALERRWMLRCPLPFGLSLFAVLRRPQA